MTLGTEHLSDAPLQAVIDKHSQEIKAGWPANRLGRHRARWVIPNGHDVVVLHAGCV